MRIFQPIVTGSNTTTGSLHISGPVYFYTLDSTSVSYVLTYDSASGQIYYTASSLVGTPTTAAPSDTYIQYNSASKFGAEQYFKYQYNTHSFEQGSGVTAPGYWSHAQGTGSLASGNYSHAEGGAKFIFWEFNEAIGTGSHAEGAGTTALGDGSHAEGRNTLASGSYSHAEGLGTHASRSYSHAEGWFTLASGLASHAEGNFTTTPGWYSHAEGFYTTASGWYSHAEGSNSVTLGTGSHAEGANTTALGDYSHAEGFNTLALGDYSHAEGQETIASGNYSHTEGYQTFTSRSFSHAEGFQTSASGLTSHAEGLGTEALGNYSHAEGSYTIASGGYSHAEGRFTTASGDASHTAGYYTIALGDYQSIIGQYNITSTSQSAFIIGDGTSDNNRHNLLFADNNIFEISASNVFLQGLPTSPEANILVYNTSSGQVYYTSSNVAITPPFPYTGSAGITGSIDLIGSMFVSGAISASFGKNTVGFYGTASWAENVLTASFITASNVWGPFGSSSVLSASYASGSTSASYAVSASVSAYALGINLSIQDENITVKNSPTFINFTGSNVLAAANGTGVDVFVDVSAAETASFTNSTTWNFTHNLKHKYVVIQALDTDHKQIIPESIQLIDTASAVLTFPTPESGYAIATIGGALNEVANIFSSTSSIVGNNTDKSFDIVHNFGTRDLHVTIYENSGNYETIYADILRPNVNTIRVNFAGATPPTSQQFVVYISR